jgi:hypothetical protein
VADWLIPSLKLGTLENEAAVSDLALSRQVTDLGRTPDDTTDVAQFAQGLAVADFDLPAARVLSSFQATATSGSAVLKGGGINVQGGDIVTITVQDGSYIQVGNNNPITFGDPTTDMFNNTSIDPDGNVFVARSDIQFGATTLTFAGMPFTVQLRAQSDLNGTYDRGSGSATATVALDVKITNNTLPNFNNNTCIIPATTLNLTTDNGTPFSGGAGTMVDNTFAAPAIPRGACGNAGFVDYAQLINQNLGLPSDAGNNVISLNLQMDPSLPP